MKSKRYTDGSNIRRVLAGMITDPTVCSRIASQWIPEGLFADPDANLIASWCIKHLQKYGTPPNDQLLDLYQNWAETSNASEKRQQAVEKKLRVLSDEEDRRDAPSSDYLLDVATKIFLKAKLRKEIEGAEDEIDRGRVLEAHQRLIGMNLVELGEGNLVKPAEDYEAWRRAFDRTRREQLIFYPGGLDMFLGQCMARGELYSFMGADKCGKSFLLLDLAFRGIRDRKKVAFFDCGDMNEEDIMMRLGTRAALHPEYPCTCKKPIEVDKKGIVVYKIKKFTNELTPQQAYKAFKKVSKGKDLLRLSCHLNSTLDVTGIFSIVKDWARQGWLADIIAIDYADILAPPRGINDPLDQIDQTWKQLRRLSQELNCLVVTATQSSAAAYKEKEGMLTRRHFSGRKTKLAHVNGMIGINVTPEEKDKGVIRLNWVVRRKGRNNDRRSITVAGCWDIASPTMKSA